MVRTCSLRTLLVLSIAAAIALPLLCPLTARAQIDHAYVPGEVIVKFSSDATQADVDAVLGALQAVPEQPLSSIDAGLYRINTSVEDALASYASHAGVEYIEPNYLWYAEETPNDPRFGDLWGLQNTGQTGGTPGADISATRAWDIFKGSASVLVGVIDTGVDITHPDLAANIYTNPGEIAGNGIDDDGNGFIDDVHGWDFANGDNDPYDDVGHGTHVSGTIGAVGDNGVGVVGVNWTVTILPIKFLAPGGGTTANAVASVEYATMMGVDLTNNSWGGGPYSEALRGAIDAAGQAGILFVAAAGNEASNTDVFPHYPSSYDLESIVSVAATNHNDDLAGFSNYGLVSVDLAAPGQGILSTLPASSYGVYDGTSMATPHVTGVLALMKGFHPGMSAALMRDFLLASVDPVPALSGLVATGGRLNAFAVLAEPDSIPPAAVDDLTVLEVTTGNGIRLQWTATGDDGLEGTASYYDLRYSTSPIDEMNFDAATQVVGEPDPGPPGTVEETVVEGLDFATTYYLAVKVLDELHNVSPVSNVVSAMTLPPPRIVVTPLALDEALLTGATSTQPLTLQNDGDSDLHFSISMSEGGVTKASPQVLHERYPTAITPVSAAIADGLDDDPYDGGSSGSKRPRTDSPPELLATTSAAGWNVLIVHAGDVTQIQSALLQFADITLVDALDGSLATPTLDDLLAYDTVILAPNAHYADPSALGDNLADYVDAGGGVILTTPAHVSGWQVTGRFLAEGYSPFETGFGPIGSGALGSFDASHPIMEGVTAATGDLLATAPLAAGAQWVADWNIGETCVATQGEHVVGVNVFVAGSGGWTGDIPLILRNAVNWASTIPWLRVVPGAGTIPAGDGMTLDVTFDATGLIGGVYDRTIVVSSNDPIQPEVPVAAHLDVTGAPDIQVDPVSLDFGDVFLGAAPELTLTVSNPGTDVLTVGSLQVDHPDFSLSHASLVLVPDESQDVTVTYTPSGLGPAQGTITLDSDDPDEPVVTIPVSGAAIEPPDIAVSPSSLSEALFSGETSTQTLTIANTGNSDLTFTIDITDVGGASQARWQDAGDRIPPRVSKVGGTSSTTGSTESIVPRNLEGYSLDPAVLVIQDGLAWGLDMGTFLETEVGIVPSVINSDLLAGMDLTAYDLVITTGDQSPLYYDRISTSAAQFEDFARQGGVIQYQLATQGSDVQVAGGATMRFGPLETFNTVVAPTHPIVAGLPTQLEGSAANHTVVTSLPTGALVITETSQSHEPTTVEYQLGAGRVLATGMTWEFLWVQGFDAGEMLLLASQYTLEEALGQWLSTDVVQGTVAPQSSLDVQVTFDATKLFGGHYEAQIVVNSDDPDEPTVAVPAQLDVTGAPSIEVSDTTLDFGQPFVNTTSDLTLTVSNAGTDLLTVTSLSVDDPVFQTDTTPFDLSVGESRNLVVTFAPTIVGPVSGSLTLESNDPGGPVVVELLGDALSPPDIAVSPTSFDVSVAAGTSTSRVLTLQNEGLSDLLFQMSYTPASSAMADTGPLADGVVLEDDFEDGDFAGWLAAGVGGIREVTSDTAANGTQDSYHESFSSEGHLDGIYQTFSAVQLQYVSFWVRSGSTTTNDAYVVLRDAGGKVMMQFFASDSGRFSLNAGVGGSESFAYSAETWYHIELREIDFTAKTMNFYVDGQLVQFGVPFRNEAIQKISRVDLYNYTAASQAWWDEIKISTEPLRWLILQPEAGTIPAGGSADVTVTFDAQALAPGAYDATILAESNDPDEPVVSIPTHLAVVTGADVVQLALGDDAGAQGSTVTVPLTVSLPVLAKTGDPSQTAGVDVMVQWDPAIATLVDVALTPATSDWLMEFNPGDGTVDVSMASVTPIDVTPTGIEFLQFAFELVAAEGTTPLTITDSRVFDLNQEAIEHVTVGGSLTAGCEKGDVIPDGEVNSADAIRGLLFAMDLLDPTPQEFCAADMNLDGSIAVGDVVLILQKAVGTTGTLSTGPARLFAQAGDELGTVVLRVAGAAGFDLVLTYDPSVVSFDSFTAPGSKGLTAANEVQPGTLRVGFARDTAYDGDLVLKFEVNDASSPLRFVNVVAYDGSGAKQPVELSNNEFFFGVTGVDAPSLGKTRLLAAVPNPFNPRTRLRFVLSSPGDARLTIFNVAGRRVKELALRGLAAGEHFVPWDGRDDAGARVASGSYLVRLEAQGITDTGRILLLK